MSSISATMTMANSTSTSILDPSETTSGSPFMLPGMSSPEQQVLKLESGNRVVRFDRECVLIPESPKSKKTMVVTRSYSLPLWKKRGRSGQRLPQGVGNEASDGDEQHTATTGPRKERARPSSPEDPNASSRSRVVLKVPIPTFRRRSSHSPSRGRSVSTSPMAPYGLTPCLVHRDPSTSPEIPIKLPSSCSTSSIRPSLPIYHRRKDDVTIPLRECCQACERITEECLSEGEHWQEIFSREAKRRRSASWEYQCSLREMGNSRSAAAAAAAEVVKNYSAATETGTVVEDGDESGDLEVDPPSNFSITVDEVDKRLKSFDLPMADIVDEHSSTPPASPGPFSTAFSFEPHGRDMSTSSTASSSSSNNESRAISDIFDSRYHLHQHQQRLLRSSPIEEEDDEMQLFPLPRRTPSTTPSPKNSPSPSPNGSTACLPTAVGAAGAAAGSSKDSLNSVSRSSSSQESLLKASLSRRSPVGLGSGISNGSGNVLPFPHSNMRGSSPRSVSPLAFSGSGSGSRSSEESVAEVLPARATAASQSLGAPAFHSSKHRRASSLSASIPSRHSPTSATPDTSGSQQQVQRQDAKNAPLPSVATSSSSGTVLEPSQPTSPTLSTSPKTSKLAPSPNLVASPLSSSSSGKRKLSFTVPFNKVSETIRGVGADMLKGVNTMGSAGTF